jgi:WD40 repeat protein
MIGSNPFVGPRPIETGRPIFGRDREREELYYLLSAERVVLLHSPSGAGKSSLIQAGLIPRLKPLFDVWRPARVNLATNGSAVNRYTRSAILGLEAELPENKRRPESEITGMTLDEYVQDRPRRRSAPQHVVLIFDQFEEILTADPLALDAKKEFFDQLGRLLQDSRIWALFALREDYLAALSLYGEQVPTHLKNLYRLDLLSRTEAQTAISETAARAGRTFTSEAVNKLVEDLAMVQVQQQDGTFVKQAGPHVEPMHLQVVCRRLWDRIPDDKDSVEKSDLEAFGDITKALASYYEDEIGKMPGGQRAIREWVGEKLIKRGIRAQVLRGAGASGGLDNEVIAHLVDAHLVRAEQRSSATWYELAHDRLIEPVLENNEEWFDANLTKFEKMAVLWESRDRLPGLLLQGADLAEAREWTKLYPELTDAEQRFLTASEEAQAAADKERRQARWIRRLAYVLGIVTLIALVALYQTRLALRRQAMASSVSLAYQSEHEPNRDLRLLVALRALASWDTPNAEEALHSAVQYFRGPRFYTYGQKYVIRGMGFSADSKLLVTANSNDSVSFWDPHDFTLKKTVRIAGVENLAVRRDGTAFVATSDGAVQIVDPSGNLGSRTVLSKAALSSIAISSKGMIAAGDQDGLAFLFAAQVHPLAGHSGPVRAVAFTPDGNTMITASVDGTAIEWDTSTAQKRFALPLNHSFLNAPLVSLAISPSGAIAVVGDSLGSIKFRNISPDASIMGWTAAAHKKIEALAFRPDGQILVSASQDKTIKLWNVDRSDSLGAGIDIPCGNGDPNEGCTALAFMSDGHTLGVAGENGEIRLFETDLQKLFSEAGRIVDTDQIKPWECTGYFGTEKCIVPDSFTQIRRVQ